MRTYTFAGRKFKACGSPCADGFKSDRVDGIIHGPYCDENGRLYKNAEEASLAANFCAYCGADSQAEPHYNLAEAARFMATQEKDARNLDGSLGVITPKGYERFACCLGWKHEGHKADCKNDSLASALAALDAVEVAPGRYAYQQNPNAPWRTFGTDALHNLAVDLGPGGKGYGPWACTLEYAEMPSWWTPERRFAWRVTESGGSFSYYSGHQGSMYDDFMDLRETHAAEDLERITADLETGEEVSA